MVTLLDFSGETVKAARVQSPSSILTFKQCPRKYYYRYIARLPSMKSIHLVRGSVTHKVLEKFYAKDLSKLSDNDFPTVVKVMLQEMFRKEWQAAEKEFEELDLTAEELEQFYEETKVMVHNFFHYLMDKLKERGGTYAKAFTEIRPRTEVKMQSEEHSVMGFADAVHEHDGKTFILDYKTSKHCEITPEYELQLSIYGLLFEELEKLPDEVGIFFLKHGQELKLPVTKAMVERARREIHAVHRKTQSKKIDEYPLQPGPLCKWSTGQCDFYEHCFGNKKLDEFTDLVRIGKPR